MFGSGDSNAAPASASGGLFGQAAAANNAPKPGGLFGATPSGTTQSSGSLFGNAGGPGAVPAAGGSTGTATGGQLGGGLFGAKPADQNATSNPPKPTGSRTSSSTSLSFHYDTQTSGVVFGAPATSNTNTGEFRVSPSLACSS